MTRVTRVARRVKRGLTRRVQTAVYSFGSAVECCFCGWTGSRFLPAGARRRANRLCPRCGSLERYRALMLYLKDHLPRTDSAATLLEIAPKPCFRAWCRSLRGVRYIGSDLSSSEAMVLSNLTQMGFRARSVDCLVCFHVLEHIQDDVSALNEIGRVLKPGGFALIMVPLRGAETLEDPEAEPTRRETLFGQADHVRFYGMDIVDRMRAAGLAVETVDLFDIFPGDVLKRHALFGDDRVMFRVCPQAVQHSVA